MISACKADSIQCNLSNTFFSISDFTGMGPFFYELNNLLFVSLITFYFGIKHRIPKIFLVIMLFHFILPFLLNGLMFSPDYMPDQYRYWNGVVQFRSLNFDFEESITVYFASLLLSLVPVPFIFSLMSVGLINKLIFSLTFIYLYKIKFLNRISAWFYIFYPSFALYSGLALRDTLILFFMVMSSAMLLKRFYIKSMLFTLPLLILKFPIAPILFITHAGYIFCIKNKNIFSRKRFLLYLFSLLCLYLIISPILIEPINIYRMALYFEDMNTLNGYSSINSLSSLSAEIIYGLNSAFFSPNPLSSSGFQFIQSIENIFIFIFLFTILLIHKNNNNIGRLIFWIISFLIIISIYSLVVFNLGTFSRYKYPMVAWFVIIVTYEIYRSSNKKLMEAEAGIEPA